MPYGMPAAASMPAGPMGGGCKTQKTTKKKIKINKEYKQQKIKIKTSKAHKLEMNK